MPAGVDKQIGTRDEVTASSVIKSQARHGHEFGLTPKAYNPAQDRNRKGEEGQEGGVFNTIKCSKNISETMPRILGQ